MAFETRMSFTNAIHDSDVKSWVADNIDRWKEEAPSWFKIEMIPDDFLPRSVLEAEGGAARRMRSDVILNRALLSMKSNLATVRPEPLTTSIHEQS